MNGMTLDQARELVKRAVAARDHAQVERVILEDTRQGDADKRYYACPAPPADKPYARFYRSVERYDSEGMLIQVATQMRPVSSVSGVSMGELVGAATVKAATAVAERSTRPEPSLPPRVERPVSPIQDYWEQRQRKADESPVVTIDERLLERFMKDSNSLRELVMDLVNEAEALMDMRMPGSHGASIAEVLSYLQAAHDTLVVLTDDDE